VLKVFKLAQNQLHGFHNNSSDLTAEQRISGLTSNNVSSQGNKRVAKRLWACVSAERQHSSTCSNLWYCKTFYYFDKNTVEKV